ncbi:MAG: LysR family transcriptional regulator [Ilumatobacteraceae bacterium]|nr:LysR family transcriptional regulator [Ilumatobacteraceae bacterium]
MDLRQLEYIIAVADHGTFTKAAVAMHVSQPSLSNGVRNLESELGVELFKRLGRTVRLTSAGEQVVHAGRRVIRDVADLTTVSRSVADIQTGQLDLVALPTLAVDPLAQLVGKFRTRFPGITIHVGEPEDASSIEREVSSGNAELGFTDITTGGSGLARVELFRQEVFAVCPPTTTLPDGPITPDQLAALPLIATPPGTSTRRLLDRVISRSQLDPSIAVQIHFREAILPLVLAGAGIALLPAPMAHDAKTRGAVVRSLRPAVTRRIGVVHRPGLLSPAATAMLRLSKKHKPPRSLPNQVEK